MDAAAAAAVVFVLASIAFMLVRPVIREPLAQGENYRYNIGGERVEGSTSLLWTLILIPFFSLSDRPESAIAVLCATMTFATTLLALRMARTVSPVFGVTPRAAALATATSLAVFPSFYLWLGLIRSRGRVSSVESVVVR